MVWDIITILMIIPFIVILWIAAVILVAGAIDFIRDIF